LDCQFETVFVMQADSISKLTYWKLKKLDSTPRSKQLKSWENIGKVIVIADSDIVDVSELEKLHSLFENKYLTFVGVTSDKSAKVDFPVFYKKSFLFFQWLKPAENIAGDLPEADLAFVFAKGDLWALAMALCKIKAHFRICSSQALTEFCDLTVIPRGKRIYDFIAQALKYLKVLYGENN